MSDLYNLVNRMEVTDNITAFAGGGQTNATPLPTQVNRVTAVGTAGDSVKLPISRKSDMIVVINADAADSMNVYGQTGDQINALGANAAFALASGKTAIFFCTAAGQWYVVLTA